jgi:hypothetical protein
MVNQVPRYITAESLAIGDLIRVSWAGGRGALAGEEVTRTITGTLAARDHRQGWTEYLTKGGTVLFSRTPTMVAVDAEHGLTEVRITLIKSVHTDSQITLEGMSE